MQLFMVYAQECHSPHHWCIALVLFAAAIAGPTGYMFVLGFGLSHLIMGQLVPALILMVCALVAYLIWLDTLWCFYAQKEVIDYRYGGAAVCA